MHRSNFPFMRGGGGVRVGILVKPNLHIRGWSGDLIFPLCWRRGRVENLLCKFRLCHDLLKDLIFPLRWGGGGGGGTGYGIGVGEGLEKLTHSKMSQEKNH